MKKADSFGIKSPGTKNISRSASGNAGGERGNYLNSESQLSITSLNAVPSGSTDMGSTEGLVPSFAPHNVQN
jgi:hypothetical protein